MTKIQKNEVTKMKQNRHKFQINWEISSNFGGLLRKPELQLIQATKVFSVAIFFRRYFHIFRKAVYNADKALHAFVKTFRCFFLQRRRKIVRNL